MAKVGLIFEAVIRDIASDGRGIAPHESGAVVFVPGVWTGETCRIKIVGKKGRAFIGQLVEVIMPSLARCEPPCAHHGFTKHECGGCPWMFVDYQQQLVAKQKRVTDYFERLGAEDKVQPIWAAEPLGYRNRAQFKTDGVELGFVAEGTNQIAAIQDCLILSPANRKTLEQLIRKLPNPNWVPAKREKWLTLDIDENTDFENVSVNKRLPFQQGNSRQNIRMREWLTEKADTSGCNTILELFCGSGNFTEVIANADRHILAVEGDQQAIQTLSEKKLPNVKSLVANLFDEKVFEKIYNLRNDFDTLILDPPRDGLKSKNKLLRKKNKMENIFYISCDLATLVRDIQFFQDNKYKIIEVQPLDQFPHTPHIETLVHLRLK
ncbi:class I SAM-dependent RNA methyltransferase [Teredinibacter sp. KSP-S5-2]|uniref:class I SAM-dependent RNA methyltransferase n=1 Tax=Teredinibacter sp. KSP-S5-2 TaxID=3034506 RepID=UPI00293502FF|nr:class I SAM-dependent RNA methyltransferase [Teredinibacter sp. KSP-S5-2]WNO09064.1 RsmD family RNA methyltransferase [Teredinibacter sp. KSP-S5-2]